MAETVLATALALDACPAAQASFGRVRAMSFDRCALDDRLTAVSATNAGPSRTIVSCGHAVPGLEISVIDERGNEAPDGRVGAISLAGSSVTVGYHTADGPTGARQGPHATGDLGVRYEGDLYVLGRAAEMLRVRGRRVPPYDIETLIEKHPRVGVGRAAVFGHAEDHSADDEAVVAFVETNAPDDDPATLRAELCRTVEAGCGVCIADIVVVRRGSIPRTSSGKRRRLALRSSYARARS